MQAGTCRLTCVHIHVQSTHTHKHSKVKVKNDGRQVAPQKGSNYNQSINSQTLRRFSSEAQPLGFQRVLK